VQLSSSNVIITEHMISMAKTSETSINLNLLSLQEKLDVTDKTDATSYVPYKKSLKNTPFLCLQSYQITIKCLDSTVCK
jgi:hypothetical protein